MSDKANNGFVRGILDSLPITLGYISVSFGFGITAVSYGISPLSAVIISITNLTSAGQVAGAAIIASGGTYIEMAFAQLVINLRYALMSLSLSQKLDSRFGTVSRLAAAFGITDEIFAVAAGKSEKVSRGYMAGLILPAAAGWVLGTFLGAEAGELLPEMLKGALGIVIYGMFIAIFVPAARRSVGVLLAAGAAAVISCCIRYIPVFSFISDGFSIIISAVASAAAAAVLFPVKGGGEADVG